MTKQYTMTEDDDAFLTVPSDLVHTWIYSAHKELIARPIGIRAREMMRNLRHGAMGPHMDYAFIIRITDRRIVICLTMPALPAGTTHIVVPRIACDGGTHRIVGDYEILEMRMHTPTALNHLRGGALDRMVAGPGVYRRPVYLCSPCHYQSDALPPQDEIPA